LLEIYILDATLVNSKKEVENGRIWR